MVSQVPQFLRNRVAMQLKTLDSYGLNSPKKQWEKCEAFLFYESKNRKTSYHHASRAIVCCWWLKNCTIIVDMVNVSWFTVLFFNHPNCYCDHQTEFYLCFDLLKGTEVSYEFDQSARALHKLQSDPRCHAQSSRWPGGGWTNPFENMCKSNWIISPQIGVKTKKHFKLHDLVILCFEWMEPYHLTKLQVLDMLGGFLEGFSSFNTFFRWPPVTRDVTRSMTSLSWGFSEWLSKLSIKETTGFVHFLVEFLSFRHADVSTFNPKNPDPYGNTTKKSLKTGNLTPQTPSQGFGWEYFVAERPRFYPQVSMIW